MQLRPVVYCPVSPWPLGTVPLDHPPFAVDPAALQFSELAPVTGDVQVPTTAARAADDTNRPAAPKATAQRIDFRIVSLSPLAPAEVLRCGHTEMSPPIPSFASHYAKLTPDKA